MDLNDNYSRYEFGMSLLEYTQTIIKFVNLCEQNLYLPESIKYRMKVILTVLIDIVTLYTTMLKNRRN
jgi:hypothetical protein